MSYSRRTGARADVRQNREDYISAGDRARAGPDPYFVGRQPEIAMFLQALESTARPEGSAGKDETLLVQGAPGAGKTALMEECAALASQRPGHTVLRLLPEELCSAPGLIKAIDDAVGSRVTDRLARALDERGWRVGPVAVPPKRGGGESAASLIKAREGAWKDHVIVLMVDEAQNVPADSAEAAAVLSCLHGGARRARILLACYGLGNTQDRFGELGVSRLARNRITTLHPLSVAQARESIDRVFSSCGVTEEMAERDRWLEALAALSLGWPQHLRAITGIALEHLAACGMKLSAASLAAVTQAGRTARSRYYDQRLSGVALWRPVYREIAEALRSANAPNLRLDQIAEIARPHLARWNIDLDDFLSQTLRAGVLGAQDSRYSIPIPSFADYLLKN